MPFGQVGAVLLVLVIIFAVGKILRNLFIRNKKPATWHTLSSKEEREKKSESAKK